MPPSKKKREQMLDVGAYTDAQPCTQRKRREKRECRTQKEMKKKENEKNVTFA